MPPQTPGVPGTQDAQAPIAPVQDAGGQQSFDYLGDIKKRYPKMGAYPDQIIWDYLGKPQNFRQVYPKYKDLDDITITENIERLSKIKPQQAAPAQAPPGGPSITPPTGRPSAPGQMAAPSQAAVPPRTATPPQQPYVPPQERQAQVASQQIEALGRPKWDTPQAIAQDPTWYGRTLRYAGGELIGTAKAGAGMLVGGGKLVHDLASALDPFEGQKRPLGDPQLQVGKDLVDVGKGVIDVAKIAWEMMKSDEAAADPEKFGDTVLKMALTVDGAHEFAKSVTTKYPGLKPAEVVKSLNQARKGVINSTIHQEAVERAYVHREGVKVAEEEFLKAENNAEVHVKEHVTNLTTKIGNKPVEADSTAQKILDESKKTILTEPPGRVVKGKGPRAGIPTAVPSPLDDVISYIRSVKPGTWTWETVKQFRTEVGRAAARASGPTAKVLYDIYYNDLTPKLANMAKKYKLDPSWKAYNDLEAKIFKGWPILEKARAIVEGNGEGSAMANAIKDSAVLHEVLESLKPYGINAERVLEYAGKANKIMRESSEFNKSMFRYVYRINPAALISIPMMMAGRAIGGLPAGLALGAGSGFAINFLMHSVRAMGLDPALLDTVLSQRKWPGKTPIPKGEGFEEPPAPPAPPPGVGPTEPPGPPGAPPVPGGAAGPPTPVPPPVPGGARPTPEAAAAAKAATPPPTGPKTPKPSKAVAAIQANLDANANSLYGKDYDQLTPKEKREVTRATQKTGEVKTPYAGPERRTTERAISQDMWAKNQIDVAKKELAKATDENEKNILRRRIEELQKDPTLAGGGEELGREIRAARAAKPAERLATAPKEAPTVTKVPEGTTGREPGKRPGTTRETPLVRAKKQAERVAKKRAEKGPTALGGGGMEITGGGVGEAAIKAEEAKAAQQSAASPNRPVTEISTPEKEETLQLEHPEVWAQLQKMRKGVRMRGKLRPLTGDEYLEALNYMYANAEDEASAIRQDKADALIKESEGRPLSPSEQTIAKEQGAEVPKRKPPKKAGSISDKALLKQLKKEKED
jgi:hypothetical protein